MRSITRRQLTDLIGNGEGVVLVDHQARGVERPSTLHAVTCRWAAKTGARTPLRFAPALREAVRWLRGQRGDEGEDWQICSECNAHADGDDDGEHVPRRAAGETVWAADRGRDLGFVAGLGDGRLTVASFDSPQRPEVDRREVPVGETSAFWPDAGDRCFVDVVGTWQPGACAERPDEWSDTIAVQMDGTRLDAPRGHVRFRRLGSLLAPLQRTTNFARVGSYWTLIGLLRRGAQVGHPLCPMLSEAVVTKLRPPQWRTGSRMTKAPARGAFVACAEEDSNLHPGYPGPGP